MGYTQLSINDRHRIADLHAQGASLRQIAAGVDRASSTDARELTRNRLPAGDYDAAYAQDVAWFRRWRGARLERDPALRERVLMGFRLGWSPQQIVERLARENGHRMISHESLYRFVYAEIARAKDYSWRRCLPGPRPSAAFAAGAAAARPSTSPTESPSANAPMRPPTAPPLAIGRGT